MFAFASAIPSAFAGMQPRPSPHQSTEEQYLRTLAEEHERAAAFARQRAQEVRHRQQQRELEAKLRLQQQLAASLQPRPSPYQPRASLARGLSDILFEFDAEGEDAFSGYAELMHRRSQAPVIERQKRAEEQAILRALFEKQRRAEGERVADLEHRRAEQVEVERERIIRAQRERAQMAEREQTRQHLAARAAEEEKLKAFLEALVSAMNAEKEEGADLMMQAIRRSSVPVPVPIQTPARTRAPAPAPSSPHASAPAPAARPASPSPSVASNTSEASLHSISHLQDKYNSLLSSFEFPATLSFAPSTNSPASSPTLLFNPTNAPLHAYEHALTGLLTELDAVESFGDEHVRDVRRSLVRQVEGELEALEERKREMWRNQSEPVRVESVPVVVESTPAPAPAEDESTPARVESVTAPAPAPVPALPTTTDPANPLAWLAARLAQPSESEDSEVKVVREGLSARLTEPMVELSTPVEVSESVTVQEPGVSAAEESKSILVESSEPVMVEQPESFGDVAFEQPEAVAAEQSQSLSVDQPENLALEHTVIPESPSLAAESLPEPEPTRAELITIEAENDAHTPTESASPTPSPASILVSEPEAVAETELLAHPTEPEHTKPESTTFVQVFPDSDSEVDADLVSELADGKSTSGTDEFEML